MIRVEINNVKDCDANLVSRISGEKEIIYNELIQLFIHLMSNEETAELLIEALAKTTEVFPKNDKNK